MISYKGKKISISAQYTLAITQVSVVTIICFALVGVVGYKVVAFLLLMTVSVIAMLFETLPVVCAAILSALIWNFFFMPPVWTFHIDNAEDLLMFLMYFLVAMVNAVLTLKIRQQRKKARDEEERENTINSKPKVVHDAITIIMISNI